jgi:dipeptidyl aminopeptidase/acylaminoacyl peptidase
MPFAGREGFGPAFYDALFDGRNFGQLDIDEGAQAVQYMLAHGYTSPDRVGITGVSYGGYFASQSITRYPDLYAAANSQATPLDLVNAWNGNFHLPVSYWEGRVPAEDPAEYSKDSPLSQASKVRTPLLLFHGTEDPFFPASIAVDFHNQIAAHSTPVELLLFQGEGHGLGDPSNHVTAAQWQISWFRTYLSASARTWTIALPVIHVGAAAGRHNGGAAWR